MNKVKFTLLAAGVSLALAFTLSCDSVSNPSALTGHWLHEHGITGPEDMELFKDGTGVCDGASISWKVEDKRFIIQSSLFGLVSDYEVSGYRLTLTSNGEKSTYVNVNKDYLQKGSLTDSRDKKKYGTVKIGTQTWMSENLNYNADGSKCYENDESNCQKYGRLYDWETATKTCPKGWHLPSNGEWKTLADLADGNEKKLKAKSWGGTDIYGFSALPGGLRYSSSWSGHFNGVNELGYWWDSDANKWKMGYAVACVFDDCYGKSALYSVRCVQN